MIFIWFVVMNEATFAGNLSDFVWEKKVYLLIISLSIIKLFFHSTWHIFRWKFSCFWYLFLGFIKCFSFTVLVTPKYIAWILGERIPASGVSIKERVANWRCLFCRNTFIYWLSIKPSNWFNFLFIYCLHFKLTMLIWVIKWSNNWMLYHNM